ncbi:unnamed protein product [Peronospora farinosa]|uniref:Homologous-pairing protein 2 winged helix domain-containing protein n=1 Tax=Peronospora farinosa TaxID=134698 RepID=A0AAV0SUE4_9STRA|nr:unnamed protein product [Peronospora farinosa]CAI5705576.1 unnamed protein product [Peronospora farinosa]
MSDFDDEDFSLGDESSDNDRFSLDDNEEEEDDDFAEESTASDASDLEDSGPKHKKARVSPQESAVKSSKPRKIRSNATSRSLPVKNTSIGPKVTVSKAKDAATTAQTSPAASTLKVITAENAEMAVLEYMRKTNRPYSLLNVFENMHRAIAKPSLTKLLDNLVIKQELASKTYGKAAIYYMNQNNLPTPSEEERMAVEEQIKAVTAECATLEQELKSAEATLAGITSQISDVDLDTAIKQLEEDAENLEKKAETLDQPGRAPVSPGRKDELKCKIMKYRTAWVTRKRIAMDGVNQIADGMEKKPKAVLALIGLETDEDAGIKELPSI